MSSRQSGMIVLLSSSLLVRSTSSTRPNRTQHSPRSSPVGITLHQSPSCVPEQSRIKDSHTYHTIPPEPESPRFTRAYTVRYRLIKRPFAHRFPNQTVRQSGRPTGRPTDCLATAPESYTSQDRRYHSQDLVRRKIPCVVLAAPECF